MHNLKYLIDLEGTLVLDKSYRPICNSVSWIRELKEKKKSFIIASNNTTDKPDELIEKLRKNGLDVDFEHLMSSLSISVEKLRELETESCFVLGSDSLKSYLRDNGFIVIENDIHKVDSIIVGLDLEISNNKLKTAATAILNGANLIALHINRLYKDVDGRFGVSTGGIVSALEYATQVKATVIGKPEKYYYEKALEKLDAKPEETLFIGDDPFSDLAGAKKLGIITAFVLSGKYNSRMIIKSIDKNLRPDFIVRGVDDINIV